MMFATAFIQNGNTTSQPILPFANKYTTYIFTNIIIGYNIDQIKPKTQSAGAQNGLFNWWYQSVEFMTNSIKIT